MRRLSWVPVVGAMCLAFADQRLVIGVKLIAVEVGSRIRLAVPPGLIQPDVPRENPLTIEKVTLGHKLFTDVRLSIHGDTSCDTCHAEKEAFAEHRATSIDASGRRQRRNAPSVLNTGYLSVLLWDGRSSSLEAQVFDAFKPWGDMGVDIGDAVAVAKSDPTYQEGFMKAFGGPPNAKALARAIASYERSLVSGRSRFDRFLFENDHHALTSMEQRGYELFIREASCITCHDIFHPDINPLGGRIALFTDQRFHNLGVGYAFGRMKDTGRFEVTRDTADWGSFKTPSLRNVALTAPYMHDGSLQTLDDVMLFYNRGGIPNPNRSPGIRPLYLDARQRLDLVAFLRTLTSEQYDESNVSR